MLERKKPAARNIGIDLDAAVIATWSDRIPRLPFALDLHHGDAVAFLRGYRFTGRELVYSDPPYLHETRSHRRIYRHELTDAQHVELLDVLTGLPCAAMVSGYSSALYRTVLQDRHGWRCVEFPAMTRGGLRTERLWLNFDPTDVHHLHDSRYAGDNYRERERIKRKRTRWRRRFEAMPPAERQVILEALLEADTSRATMAAATVSHGDDRSTIATHDAEVLQ